MKSSQRNCSEVWLRASPRGTRSGFAALADGCDGVVTLTVLPKPWAPRIGVVRDYSHVPGATTHLVLHETELAHISTAAACAGELALGVARIAEAHPDLIELTGPSKNPIAAEMPGVDPFGDVVSLMVLAERQKNSVHPDTNFKGEFALSILRILRQAQFVELVKALIFRARPQYEERVEVLRAPRGRLREASLLLSRYSGIPEVECVFDDLTMDTPLLQVMASALRVVATESIPPLIASIRPGIQMQATLLLRHLSTVSLVDRDRALFLAERLHLGSLDRFWQPALDAALPVLRSHAVTPSPGRELETAIAVHVEMEKFWEQCLETTLDRTFPAMSVSRDKSAGPGVIVPSPWFSEGDDSRLSSDAYPDFMFRVGRHVVVADAKYKSSRGTKPSAQDAYQLFAYSHLAELEGQGADISMILYPAGTESSAQQHALQRMRDRTCVLWHIALPFPSRSDIRSTGSWSMYVARLARTLRDFSTAWTFSGLRAMPEAAEQLVPNQADLDS